MEIYKLPQTAGSTNFGGLWVYLSTLMAVESHGQEKQATTTKSILHTRQC